MQFISIIYSVWDYFYFVLISGDIAPCETSDRVIESRALDVTYSQGYVATSYYMSIQLNGVYSQPSILEL